MTRTGDELSNTNFGRSQAVAGHLREIKEDAESLSNHFTHVKPARGDHSKREYLFGLTIDAWVMENVAQMPLKDLGIDLKGRKISIPAP